MKIGARKSPLSRAQVEEIRQLCDFPIDIIYVETVGDRDQTTSLRTMEKTDFFTKELDHLLLNGEIDIAIHSAKDLPHPIPEGLEIVAITQGVDSSDSLVYNALPKSPLIGTSSDRREEAVREIIPNARFCDIRGNIGQRLALMESGAIDGLVIAEAALIRLGLTHLNRYTLPGETVPLQGKLAIVSRRNDRKAYEAFCHLDARTKTVLYTGLELPEPNEEYRYVHYPMIRIVPRKADMSGLIGATHVIFTSKTAVRLMADVTDPNWRKKTIITVGKSTAKAVEMAGGKVKFVAKNECAEGIVEILDDIQSGSFFWPHSARSRSVITDYLQERGLPHSEVILYDTVSHFPEWEVNWSGIDIVHFTSPSTVDAFMERFGSIPDGVEVSAIGKVTRIYLGRTYQFQK